MKMKMKNRSHIYVMCVWWWCLYVLSNAYATFQAQFMRKLSNTEAEFKNSVACKKACTASGFASQWDLYTLEYNYLLMRISFKLSFATDSFLSKILISLFLQFWILSKDLNKRQISVNVNKHFSRESFSLQKFGSVGAPLGRNGDLE